MVTSMYRGTCKKGNGKNYMYIYDDDDYYTNRLLFTHEQAEIPFISTSVDARSANYMTV